MFWKTKKVKLSWFSNPLQFWKLTNVKRSLQVSNSYRRISIYYPQYFSTYSAQKWTSLTVKREKNKEDEKHFFTKYTLTQIIENLQQRQLNLITRSERRDPYLSLWICLALIPFEVQTDLFSLLFMIKFMQKALLHVSKPCSWAWRDWQFSVAL